MTRLRGDCEHERANFSYFAGAELTEAWAQALAPRRFGHVREVGTIAAELAGPLRKHLVEGGDLHWDEDIRINGAGEDP